MIRDGISGTEHAGENENGSGIAAESSAAARKRQKRRVPEADRQRVESSCDRCRTRKIRCIRLDDDDVCAACRQGALSCETNIPRKQRIYATVEQLGVRYRVMDAVIRAAYPGKDLESLEGMTALAKELGVEVELQEDGGIRPLDPKEPGGEGQRGAIDRTQIDLPTKGTLPYELRPFLSSHAVPLSSDSMSGVFQIPEGSLVPAPKGGYHYVGPASLAVFAKSARELVSKCNFATMPTFDEAGLKRFLKAAEFTTFRTSQAIEARIEGHPATSAVDVEEESELQRPFDDGFGPFGVVPPHISPVASSPLINSKSRRMVDLIPDRSLSDRLVAAFFDRVHPNFTVFHRGTFQMRYETIWSHTQWQARQDMETGWLCALYMIYVLGAQCIEEELGAQSAIIQERYLGSFLRDGLHRLALTASLANVQALMLLSLYQHNAGERNAAWMLLGQAARTAVALGMHRDGEHMCFDPFERNARRTVWWVLHMFEQNLSFALGRPSDTDLIDTTAVLPEEIYLDGNDLPPGYFERAVALTEICSRAKRFTASIATYYQDPIFMASTCGTANHIISQLTAWRDDLPIHLSSTYHFATPRHRRAATLLHILCDHLRSIVGRSYLLCRVNNELDCHTRGELPSLDQGISDLAATSVNAAETVVCSLIDLSTHNLLETVVWLDLYYVHHAAFVHAIHFLGQPLTSSPKDLRQKDAISRLLRLAKQAKVAPTYRILINIALQLAYIVGIGPEEEGPDDNALNFLASRPAPLATNMQLRNPPPNLPHSSNYPPSNPSYNTLEQLFGPMAPSQHNSPPDLFADLYNFGLDTNAENSWDFFNIGVTAEGLMQELRALEEQNHGRNVGQ